MEDMISILRLIIDDIHLNNITAVKKIYEYLSTDFVHFSTTVSPTGRPKVFNSGNGSVRLWGLNGIIFCLNLLKPIMNFYYGRLKLRSKKFRKK
jgi:hypothetical protein